MGPTVIQVLPDPGTLAAAAALAVAQTVRRAVGRRGRAVIALAGGSTPVGAYRALARDHRESVPWARVHVLVGDERMVPPAHEDSNYAMIRRELLDRVPVPAEAVLRVRTELGSPEEAAAEYEERIRGLFRVAPGEVPALDLVLLGLGEDGHTASLMPGCAVLEEERNLVGWCPSDRREHSRVTLTLPVLNHAREAAFLVSGPAKAGVLRSLLEEDPAAEGLPAARVRPPRGTTRWLVDADAARDLPPVFGGRAGPRPPATPSEDENPREKPMENA